MPADFDLDQFKATYFEECQDLLSSAEENLAQLQSELVAVDVEILHAIFRSVHSIKGGAGAFNFTDLVSFSHTLETLLDKLREGEIKITESLVETLLTANDVLGTLVQNAQDDVDAEASVWEPVAQNLKIYTEGGQPGDETSLQEETATSKITDYNKTPEEEEEQGWGLFIDDEVIETTEVEEPKSNNSSLFDEPEPNFSIKFVPELHLLRFANEPLLLARELNTMGTCKATVDISRMPDLDDLRPDEAYLSWTFDITTECGFDDIQDVFEFVIDDCLLEIKDVSTGESAASEPIATAAPTPQKAVKEEKTEPDQTPKPVEEKPELITQQSAPAVSSGNVPVVEEKQEKKEEPKAKAKPTTSASGPKVSSIRVELDRVDKLVNMVGELVITQAMLKQQAEDIPNNMGQVLAQGFVDLSAHTRDLQESVMAIRMQPVKSVFARMPRLVRELSTKLGKKIDLVTTGEMTEVDKTVIEQLMDPLTHMIRNSVDHGVETPEERLAAGKNEKAVIHLSAEHRSGRIQIEVSDDGRGINRERVREKAIEKGIIDENDDLDDEDIDNLIFAPGFSTADEVSDVSGRGVGMDVVRRNIVSLGGRISVFSTPGQGTRFLMSLPLTLAVLDGMIVKCGNEKYIIPLTAIIESIHPVKEELKNLVNGGVVASVRGEYIRLVNLYRLFNVANAISDPSEALVVIVETERYGLVGIVVDELLGQQQVVIKSLEENYDPIPGISAATILGNGKVALILDVDGLAEMEQGAEKRRRLNNAKKQALAGGDQLYGID